MKKLLIIFLVFMLAISASFPAMAETPVKSIKLNKKTAAMRIGTALTLKATIAPSKASKQLAWSSSDPNIAEVISGKITPLSTGMTTITASTENGKSASCVVTVKERNPSSVSLSSASVTLAIGDTFQLAGTVSPEDADGTLAWSSSKKGVASVSPAGLVTANKAGTAKITVKTVNGKKSVCTVTVPKPPAKMSKSDMYMKLGGTTIKFPTSGTKLRKALGNCTIRSTSTSIEYYLGSEAHVSMAPYSNVLFVANAYEGSDLRTNRGVGIGDTGEKVLALYGQPTEMRDFTYDDVYVYTTPFIDYPWPNHGDGSVYYLRFAVHKTSGRVRRISLVHRLLDYYL